MTKTKIVGGVVAVAVVALAGGGFYLYHGHKTPSANQASSNSQTQQVSIAVPVDTTNKAANSSISLNQNFDTPQSGGLAVTSNSGSASATQAAGTQQTPQTLGQSTSNQESSASQSNPFDPTTFAQYDKYKNDKGGLFADVTVGTGTALTAGKKAAVYYRGWLTNGTKFDESRPGSDGKLTPFIFTLGDHQVITGWEQALAGMKVGGVRLVIVPPAVGYGATAQNGIPANSVLVFQVQLAEVQ